jgi:hypothetical protein
VLIGESAGVLMIRFLTTAATTTEKIYFRKHNFDPDLIFSVMSPNSKG